MATEPVRAGSGWLALREPADAAARSTDLVEILRPTCRQDGHAGPRPRLRHGFHGPLARPRLPGPQRWVLHDRDAELLARAATQPAARSARRCAVSVETRLGDITRLRTRLTWPASRWSLPPRCSTCSPSDALERFVAGCAAAGCPVLVTLSVVGQVELGRPPIPSTGR